MSRNISETCSWFLRRLRGPIGPRYIRSGRVAKCGVAALSSERGRRVINAARSTAGAEAPGRRRMEKLGARDRGQNTKPKPGHSLAAGCAAFDRPLDKRHQDNWLARS